VVGVVVVVVVGETERARPRESASRAAPGALPPPHGPALLRAPDRTHGLTPMKKEWVSKTLGEKVERAEHCSGVPTHVFSSGYHPRGSKRSQR